jgi:hypothetical protein
MPYIEQITLRLLTVNSALKFEGVWNSASINPCILATWLVFYWRVKKYLICHHSIVRKYSVSVRDICCRIQKWYFFNGWYPGGLSSYCKRATGGCQSSEYLVSRNHKMCHIQNSFVSVCLPRKELILMYQHNTMIRFYVHESICQRSRELKNELHAYYRRHFLQGTATICNYSIIDSVPRYKAVSPCYQNSAERLLAAELPPFGISQLDGSGVTGIKS